MHQHIGHDDAGAHLQQFAARRLQLASVQFLLRIGDPIDGGDDAVEFGQQPVAHGLEHLAAHRLDAAGDEMLIDPAHQAHGLPLIMLHKAGEPHHVDGDDRDQPSFRFGHDVLKRPNADDC